MPRQFTGLLSTLLISLLLIVSWGCAPNQTTHTATTELAPVAALACGAGLEERVAQLDPSDIGPFLARAETEGGATCWSETIQSALAHDKSLPREQLVRALETFNRHANIADFHRAVGQYLQQIADYQSSYTLEDRALLEAYSRFVIRTARSQDDPDLRRVQTACARLDRALYARLFE